MSEVSLWPEFIYEGSELLQNESTYEAIRVEWSARKIRHGRIQPS